MSDLEVGKQPERFEVRATTDSHFSWLRTRLAVETTLLAWIRTAVSMIGFGFAIVQFFDHFHQLPGGTAALFPDAAWYLGLALIFCGVVAWSFRSGSTGGRFATCGAEVSRRSQA